MNASREHRIACNHALFRDVNERIYSLTEAFGSHPAHFVVPEVERVVEANGRYVVVERHELPV